MLLCSSSMGASGQDVMLSFLMLGYITLHYKV